LKGTNATNEFGLEWSGDVRMEPKESPRGLGRVLYEREDSGGEGNEHGAVAGIHAP